MGTLAAKGRGEKREYLYADDSTQLRSSTMDRSMETFPKSIHYPVSRDTISPVDPKKPIYLNQVNTYITYPTPTPSISTQKRRSKIHHHQRSIDSRPKAYLPSTSPIKIHPNPTQNHAPLPPPLPLPPPPPLPPHHRPKAPLRLHLTQPHPNHPSTLQIQLLHQPRPARKRSRPQHHPQSQPPRRHFLFFRDQNWRNHT